MRTEVASCDCCDGACDHDVVGQIKVTLPGWPELVLDICQEGLERLGSRAVAALLSRAAAAKE